MDPYFAEIWAAVASAISVLFTALLASYRGRIKSLERDKTALTERFDNLQRALEECYERHEHGG